MKKWSCDCFIDMTLNLPDIEAETKEEAEKIFKKMIENEEWSKGDLEWANGGYDLSFVGEA